MSEKNNSDQQWIARCIELAQKAIGKVSPNPPVGAVLVHEDQILGEGYHSFFGGPHAEVEAIKDVPENQRHLIPESTLYVSLEPCCIYGKTPPCTDLIIRENIKDVRVSILDPNPLIAGKGLEVLRNNGIRTQSGILEEKGKELIKAFRVNILIKRPYIILKWAQSKYGFIGKENERVFISHPYTNTWSHKLRSHADAIIVGARTVMIDNPHLTTRDAPGRSPHRVIYDPSGKLDSTYYVFNHNDRRVFYFSEKENPKISGEHIFKIELQKEVSHIQQIISTLFDHQIGILLVEGGTFLINLFIKENLWDEAWVIRSDHELNSGVAAPNVRGKLIERIELATDLVVGIANEPGEG